MAAKPRDSGDVLRLVLEMKGIIILGLTVMLASATPAQKPKHAGAQSTSALPCIAIWANNIWIGTEHHSTGISHPTLHTELAPGFKLTGTLQYEDKENMRLVGIVLEVYSRLSTSTMQEGTLSQQP